MRRGASRRRRAVAIAFAVLLAGGCGAGGGRAFVRYHDPAGVFVADLPAGHGLTPVDPVPEGQTAPGILGGVVAEPPGAASPSSGLGGGAVLATDPDRTSFQILVVTSGGFESLDDMVLSYLTADPLIDVREERPARVGGDPGRLVVAEVLRDGAPSAGIAVVFTLGHGGTGALLAAIFPPGSWEKDRVDFLRMVRSFRADLAPGELVVPF